MKTTTVGLKIPRYFVISLSQTYSIEYHSLRCSSALKLCAMTLTHTVGSVKVTQLILPADKHRRVVSNYISIKKKQQTLLALLYVLLTGNTCLINKTNHLKIILDSQRRSARQRKPRRSDFVILTGTIHATQIRKNL